MGSGGAARPSEFLEIFETLDLLEVGEHLVFSSMTLCRVVVHPIKVMPECMNIEWCTQVVKSRFLVFSLRLSGSVP